jgi:hypothetical protein
VPRARAVDRDDVGETEQFITLSIVVYSTAPVSIKLVLDANYYVKTTVSIIGRVVSNQLKRGLLVDENVNT